MNMPPPSLKAKMWVQRMFILYYVFDLVIIILRWNHASFMVRLFNIVIFLVGLLLSCWSAKRLREQMVEEVESKMDPPELSYDITPIIQAMANNLPPPTVIRTYPHPRRKKTRKNYVSQHTRIR